jgi:hypothetical protein
VRTNAEQKALVPPPSPLPLSPLPLSPLPLSPLPLSPLPLSHLPLSPLPLSPCRALCLPIAGFGHYAVGVSWSL